MSEQTKKKIIILENNFAVGGIQKLALEQLRVLVDAGSYEVYLMVLAQPDREDFYNEVPEGVCVKKFYFTGMTDLRSLIQLGKELKKISPDLIKSSAYFSNTIARLLKIFFKYQLITAEHNTKRDKTRFQKIINRLLSPLSFTTIVDSNMVAQYLSDSENVTLDKFTVISNGVDLDQVSESQKKFLPQRDTLRLKYGVTNTEKLFLNVARMVRQKNHTRLIEAFALVCKTHSDCKLMIVGDGSLRKDLEAKIDKLNIQNKVILAGMQKDIHKFYVMSDFTVVSSDHEGFCIAALEGLAFGAPLVSTPVAGIVEYIVNDENGYISDNTPENFAQNMIKIKDLSPKKIEMLKTNALATVGRYSIDEYRRKFMYVVGLCTNTDY